MRLLKKIVPFAIGITLGLALIAGGVQLFAGYRFNGMLIRSEQRALNFNLTNATTGEQVSLADWRGKAVLLYFGYTSCPDICPATLVEMARVETLLGSRANEVQLVWITVDPERDTPEKVAEYSAYFSPNLIGLVGDADTIEATAFQYGVVYERQQVGSSAGYLVDHTATLMLIDPDGFLRVVFPYGMAAEQIAADVRYVLNR